MPTVTVISAEGDRQETVSESGFAAEVVADGRRVVAVRVNGDVRDLGTHLVDGDVVEGV